MCRIGIWVGSKVVACVPKVFKDENAIRFERLDTLSECRYCTQTRYVLVTVDAVNRPGQGCEWGT